MSSADSKEWPVVGEGGSFVKKMFVRLGEEVWDAAAVGGVRGSRRLGRDGSRRVQRVGLVALVVFLGSVALALLLSRFRGNVPQTGVAVFIGGGTLPALYLAWVGYRDTQAKDADLALVSVADELAVAVGNQWEREAAVRRLNDPFPLPVRWQPPNPPLSEDWEGLVALASSGAGWPGPTKMWAAQPTELAGTGNQLVGVLERVPTGRLVVLGEPGSGKSMLMVRLVLDLVQRRSPGGVVPVLVSAASWNPLGQDFHSWLASQLVIAHPGLAAPFSSGGTDTSRIDALLKGQLIMPILDGLDELPGAARGQAVARINDQLRPGERLVITSRTPEYREATHPAVGPEVALSAAAIELRPLDTRDVIAYLRQAAGGPRSASRWDPVFAALRAGGMLANALSSPLMVGLARTIYNPRPGEVAGALPDPAELCRFSSQKSVEDHLIDAFIPASYRPVLGQGSLRHAWNGRQAEDALAFLANHLEYTIRKPDFAWWELNAALPTLTNVTSGAIAGLAVAVSIILLPIAFTIGFIAHFHDSVLTLRFLHNFYHYFPSVASSYNYYYGYWGWVAKIVGFCAAAGSVAGLLVAIGPNRSGQRQTQRIFWNGRYAALGRLLIGLFYGTTYSLIIYFAIDFTVGWPGAPTFLGTIGGVAVLAAGLAAGLAASNETFRMGTVAVIAIGTTVGAPFLLYKYSGTGYAVGLLAGLGAGLAVMARKPDRNPSRSIHWRLRNGIVSGIEAGGAVGVLTAFATHQMLIGFIFGLVVGLGAMVVVGLERVPGNIGIATSPMGALERDRSATLTLSLVTAVAAGLAVGVGTFLIDARHLSSYYVSPGLDGAVFGLSVGPIAGFTFGLVLSGYGSAWPQWVLTRQILAVRRRVPRRLMAFLSDAHRRGVLRQVGPVYQFRHIELQHQLASRIRGRVSLAVLENPPKEYRHPRVSLFPLPPTSAHSTLQKIYFCLIFLTEIWLCINILVACVSPAPGHSYSPAGELLAALGIASSIWIGLYAYRIPSAKVRNPAIWSTIAGYIAPWFTQQGSAESDKRPHELTDPGSAPPRNAAPTTVDLLASRSSSFYPTILVALAGAISIALLMLVLVALTTTLQPAVTFSNPDSLGVESVVFSPNSAVLASTDFNGKTYLWDVAARKITATLTDPRSRGAFRAAFSPNGADLATTDANGKTYLWGVAARKVTAPLTDPHTRDVAGVAFNPNGAVLATADLNGSTYLWDVATQKITATFADPHSRGVESVAFSPNGAVLATADYNGSTYLWDVASHKITATFADPHSRGVVSVAFSPNGATIASADVNGSTYLWDVATHKITATLPDPHSRDVLWAAFSPNGAVLATADFNGNTYLWDIRRHSPPAQARPKAGRSVQIP